jgi:hypothetical protein
MCVNFQLNTGADITCISDKMATKLRCSEQIAPVKIKAWNATGGELKILGKVNVQLQLGKKACFADVFVVANLSVECLLARDVLDTCPIIKDLLDQLQNTVESLGDKLPVTADEQRVNN